MEANNDHKQLKQAAQAFIETVMKEENQRERPQVLQDFIRDRAPQLEFRPDVVFDLEKTGDLKNPQSNIDHDTAQLEQLTGKQQELSEPGKHMGRAVKYRLLEELEWRLAYASYRLQKRAEAA